ncbi:hypothetical protein NHP21005_04970 [Helicobacter sp. NHP21005]|uniref:hypothetical protein n=1 Tax=Helicobacter felistomachi TaxID=3040201 RepID=UPI00257232A1|nr:hypothetical protein [Helicobacter sp. NHP21005]BEG56809.1 hypothetical protein NHP21005_04970 [Helicobacter sp. NHP21005]
MKPIAPNEDTKTTMQAQQLADLKAIQAGQEKLKPEPPRLSLQELQEKTQEFDHFNVNEQGILDTNAKAYKLHTLKLENLLQKALHSQIAFKDLPENVKKYLKRKFVDEERLLSSLFTNNYAQAQFAKEQERLQDYQEQTQEQTRAKTITKEL